MRRDVRSTSRVGIALGLAGLFLGAVSCSGGGNALPSKTGTEGSEETGGDGGGSGPNTAGRSGGSAGASMGGVGGSASGGVAGSAGAGGSVGSAGAGGGGGTPVAMDAGNKTDAEVPSGDGGAADSGGTAVATTWPKCKPIFDGKTFDGWGGTNGWKITPDGAMASTGVGAQNFTLKNYKEFRWIFSLQHNPGNHYPCVIVWGRTQNRGLNGIQIQAPTCGGWDYRSGKNKAISVQCPKGPPIDMTKWTQCEILARATGKIRMACCQQDATGNKPCKATENLIFNDPTAPNLGPIGYMMHNDKLYDQFKNICVEEDPTEDELITTK